MKPCAPGGSSDEAGRAPIRWRREVSVFLSLLVSVTVFQTCSGLLCPFRGISLADPPTVVTDPNAFGVKDPDAFGEIALLHLRIMSADAQQTPRPIDDYWFYNEEADAGLQRICSGTETRFRNEGVYPASANRRDGFCCVTGRSLWYRPVRESWRPVVQDVNIDKTEGGLSPRLPFVYLGNRQFCVARTTRFLFWPFDPQQAMAETLWMDGMDGRILGSSGSYRYSGSPPILVDPAWWPTLAPLGPDMESKEWDVLEYTELRDGKEYSLKSDPERYRAILSASESPPSSGISSRLRVQVLDETSNRRWDMQVQLPMRHLMLFRAQLRTFRRQDP
jgi:hypothetical protein